MITPTKFTPFSSSILALLVPVGVRAADSRRVSALYAEAKDEFGDIGQFILALDVLYVLDYLDVDLATEELTVAR